MNYFDLVKNIIRLFILFCIGGTIYISIELLWRGYSHWTMFIVGGICFVLIGLINELFTYDMPLIYQMIISALIVTIVEFISGCIINLWLHMNVWDYSNMPFNIAGQICIPFMGLWFLLSLPAIILDDYLRLWFFNEEKPHYTFFKERDEK